MAKEKELVVSKNSESSQLTRKLILLNDDVNTFDFVIESLVVVCEHTPEQAETCALITHFKGKCTVKSGSRKELLPYFAGLSDRNLTVEIE